MREAERRAVEARRGPASSITWPTPPACRCGPAPVYALELAQVRVLTVLDEVERKAIDLGVVTQAELRRWHASLQALEAEGGVFCTTTRIMVAGRKA